MHEDGNGEFPGGALHLGALATHFEIESSALVRSKCPLLAEVASNIGDVQVRNVGTIGGSTAHADPAADYPAGLMALEAKVHLTTAKGERTLPIDQFIVDALSTALKPNELVREIIVPVETRGTGFSYQKLAQPASGFAVVGVAARVRKSAGKVTFVRVGVTEHPSGAVDVHDQRRPGDERRESAGTRSRPSDRSRP